MFTNLLIRSGRSLNYGYMTVREIVDASKKANQPCIAIADIATLGAVPELFNLSKVAGYKPVFCVEFAIYNNIAQKTKDSYNLVLVALNRTGFNNLVKLTTISAMYYYYRPRLDLSFVKKYAEGLAAFSGVMNGKQYHSFFIARDAGLKEHYKEFNDIFNNNYYLNIEINDSKSFISMNNSIFDIMSLFNDKVIITRETLYMSKSDIEVHKLLLKAKNFKTSSWQYPFSEDKFYLSPNDIINYSNFLYPNRSVEINQTVKNTIDFLSKVDSINIFDGYKIPSL